MCCVKLAFFPPPSTFSLTGFVDHAEKAGQEVGWDSSDCRFLPPSTSIPAHHYYLPTTLLLLSHNKT